MRRGSPVTRWTRVALRLVGPLILGALFWTTDLAELGRIMKGAAGPMLALAAGLNLAIISIKAYRWRLLVRILGRDLPLSGMVRLYAIGAAVAAWTPGRVGDFLRAVALHRDHGLELGKAVASVLVDRMMDAAAMAMVALGGVLLITEGGRGPRGILAAASLAALGITAWILTRGRKGTRDRAAAMVGPFLSARRHLGEVLDAMAAFRVRALLLPFAVTAGVTLVTFLQGFLIARGLSIEVGFWRLGTALAAASIASLLPLSVAGIGTREATLALFLVQGGTGMPEVLGLSVTLLAIANGATAVIGAVAWSLPGPRSVRWSPGSPSVDGDPGMPYNTPPRVGG